MTYGQQVTILYKRCLEDGSPNDKGAALEDLVEYVFISVPSVTLWGRDVKDEDGAQEIDLIFAHRIGVSGIPIQDVTIMVECKNEITKTSAAQIREFGSKLRTRSLPIGVLVTSAGLSGPRGKAAYAAIRDELGLGQTIIILNRAELASFQIPADLVELLFERLMELRTFRGYRAI